MLVFVFVCIFAFNMKKNKPHIVPPPWWFVTILLAMLIPLLGYPALWTAFSRDIVVGVDTEMLRFLFYSLPVYVVASQIMSFLIYNERKVMAWILQGLLLMIYLFCAYYIYNVRIF